MTTEMRYVVKARAGGKFGDLWLAEKGRWVVEKDERVMFRHKDQACRYALDACCANRTDRPEPSLYVIEIHELSIKVEEIVLTSTRVI